MINANDTRSVESTLQTIDEAQYHFDPRNLRHIAAILREMYSDPVLAVVREYSANARDAHVLAGKADDPFQITVPTVHKPEIVFRDFGKGLTDGETKELILGYGASGEEKRTSNAMVGGFGIGAKCAFAVADQFLFTSYYGGIANVWQCFRDQDDECRANKLSANPSDQPSGVEVRIPVPTEDVPVFQARIGSAFRFYDVKPTLLSAPADLVSFVNLPVPDSALSGQMVITTKSGKIPVAWKLLPDVEDVLKDYDPASSSSSRFGSSSRRARKAAKSAVIMGGIAYPLDMSQSSSQKRLDNLLIEAPIGTFQLAPSRESLSYTRRVKEELSRIVDGVIQEATAQFATKLEEDGITCTELAKRFRTIKGSLTDPNISEELTKKIDKLFGPKDMTSMSYRVARKFGFSHAYKVASGTRFSYNSSKYEAYYEVQNKLDESSEAVHFPSDVDMYVINLEGVRKALPSAREAFASIMTHLGISEPVSVNYYGSDSTEIPTVNFLVIPDRSKMKAVPAWIQDGSVTVLNFSALPPPSDGWKETMNRSSSSQRSRSSGGRSSYAQHGKKLNLYNEDPCTHSVSSEAWKPFPVQELKDNPDQKFVYLLHDRFIPLTTMTALSGYATRSSFHESLEIVKQHPEIFPNFVGKLLVGARIGDRNWFDEQKDSDRYIPFPDLWKEAPIHILKHYGITQKQLEFAAFMFDLLCISEYSGRWSDTKDRISGSLALELAACVSGKKSRIRRLVEPFLNEPEKSELFTKFFVSLKKTYCFETFYSEILGLPKVQMDGSKLEFEYRDGGDANKEIENIASWLYDFSASSPVANIVVRKIGDEINSGNGFLAATCKPKKPVTFWLFSLPLLSENTKVSSDLEEFVRIHDLLVYGARKEKQTTKKEKAPNE